tara:strand:+ start:1021 stop:3324 length:2304 start_codon:yes stop_codon:yes gene_type:complete
MSEIKIISVEIENFRQYYGNSKVNFISRDEGFNVIFGYNGEGKSNFLNAVNWCLYEYEPHGVGDMVTDAGHSENKSLPVINNRCIAETKDGTVADVKVTVWLQKGTTVYSIIRTLKILKHRIEKQKLTSGIEEPIMIDVDGIRIPKGCEILETKFSVLEKKEGASDFSDTIRFTAPENMVKEILPQDLAQYFLLDGEFMEQLWKSNKNIRDGIERISQLHLISGTSDHIQRHLMIPSKGYSKDTDDLNDKMRAFDRIITSKDQDGIESWSDERRVKINPEEEDAEYHASGEPRLKDIEEDIDKVNNRLIDLSDEIRRLNISGQEKLKVEYAEVEKLCEELKKKTESAGNTFLFNLTKYGPQLMLKNSIKESVEIIEKEIAIGGLPVKYKRLFADSLLDSKTCVCHESLEPGDERTKHVQKFKEGLVGKEELDDVALLGDNYKRFFLDKYDEYCLDKFGSLRKNYSYLKGEYDKQDQKLAGIKTKISSAGGEEGEKIIQEQRDLQDKIKILNEWRTNTIIQIKEAKGDRGEVKRVLDKALKSNSKAKKAAHELKIWDRTAILLDKLLDSMKETVRKNVEEQTWENYQNLLANPSEFEEFSIEPDYTVHLNDKFGNNKVRNLSAGQSLLMTISFVAAIREPTGYKFPLIVDSPSGKIDGPNSHNIGMRLPYFLPDAQLTLLVTNKEYTDYISPDPRTPNLPKTPICQLFTLEGTCDHCKKSFGNLEIQHSKIIKEISGENVGNSEIKPAKLEFIDIDEDHTGWAVVENE